MADTYNSEKIIDLVEAHLAVNGSRASLPDALTKTQRRSAINHITGVDGAAWSYNKTDLQTILTHLGGKVDGSRTCDQLRAAIADEAGFDYDDDGQSGYRSPQLGELLKTLADTEPSTTVSTTTNANRGSKSSHLIPVVVAGVVGYVGITVVESLSSTAFQKSAEEIETVCNGVFGCNGIQTHELAVIGLLIALPIVIATLAPLSRRFVQSGGGASDETGDRLESIKNAYVDDDGMTVIELEDRLDDAMKGGDQT